MTDAASRFPLAAPPILGAALLFHTVARPVRAPAQSVHVVASSIRHVVQSIRYVVQPISGVVHAAPCLAQRVRQGERARRRAVLAIDERFELAEQKREQILFGEGPQLENL